MRCPAKPRPGTTRVLSTLPASLSRVSAPDPYTGHSGECAFRGKPEATATIANYTCLPSDESFILAYLLAHGPVSVALDARFLQFFGGGICAPFALRPVLQTGRRRAC